MTTVLQIMDYAAPYEGNFIPSIDNLENHLTKSGNRLIYVFPASARNIPWLRQLQNSDKTIYFIDRSFFSKKVKIRNIKTLLKIIKTEKVNLIHTHFVSYNYTLALIKEIFLRNIKITGNFMNEFHPPSNKFRRFKIFITKYTFHTIIASSLAVKDSLVNAGIESGKVVVVYNALDTEHLKAFERINFATKENQKIVLMFGWTFHRKGVDIAINAIKELVSEGNDIRLVIAMAGGIDITEKEITNLLGFIPTWITIIGPHQQIASYYNSTDIFLSSSREEGFTYSVLEAAYCNPMIIASEIGGHPLDIPHISSFENENIQQLKTSIKKTLEKTIVEKEKIKTLQKQYVIDNYNLDKWSESIIKVYSKVFV